MTQVAKKRLSKKTKGSWRKIEHKDVDNFLEDQRLEERIGYVYSKCILPIQWVLNSYFSSIHSKISDKPDEELFTIDTEPAAAKKPKLSARDRRKKQLNRAPKCLAALINQSKVTDPIVKRNRVRSKEERKHPIAKSIEVANAKKGIVKQKLLTSVSDRTKAHDASEAKRARNKKKAFDIDLWETGTPAEQREDFKSPWLTRKITEHNIKNTGTSTVKPPSSAFHKRSKLM